jgi:hypothetical protein
MADRQKKPMIQLPRDALSRVRLGDVFAEQDRMLLQKDVFVKTPALVHATDSTSSKCFYVGRRGTGKTAITLYVTSANANAVLLHPQILAPEGVDVPPEKLRDVNQKHFKSLVSCYKRALVLQVVEAWVSQHVTDFDKLPQAIRRVRNEVEQMDFDLRLLTEMEEVFAAVGKNEREWLRHINGTKELIKKLGEYADRPTYRVLMIDKIDEAWDANEKSVAFLTGLMHACVELSATCAFIRPLLFLRENIYERVRKFDQEFARLESSVVSLDWSREALTEMIERRLNAPSNQKLPLGGPTWDYFFEQIDGKSSRDFVFGYCQERPRDVLAFCSYAVESAQIHKRDKVVIEDVLAARKRFSETRLKELGDEYAENYPQIQLVLARFYGLGNRFTISGIEAFIKKLLVAEDVQQFCGKWIFQYTMPERFIHLLYSIGFVGVGDPDAPVFRPLGASASAPPLLTATSLVVIHPSYADALGLHQAVITELRPDTPLRSEGVVYDAPEGLPLGEYIAKLTELEQDLKTLPHGKDDASASRFEEIVGDVIKLCFFRSLTNVEPRVRNSTSRVIRDWMASNVAPTGFWEMIRVRYQAMEIIWECKNYAELAPEDFRQVSAYMTKETGRFSVIVFRGEFEKHYYEHIKRAGDDKNGGVILLLTERDLLVFIRQAKASKSREEHIQARYTATVRAIS